MRIRRLRISATLSLTTQILLRYNFSYTSNYLISWSITVSSLHRYIPYVFPGAGLDETASNGIFLGYFLTVLYTSTSAVWVLAIRPVLFDLSPVPVSGQSMRSPAYIKVKEDKAGNWSVSGAGSATSQKIKALTAAQSSTGMSSEGKSAQSDSENRDMGTSILSNCCGARWEKSSSPDSQSRPSRTRCYSDALRRRDDGPKECPTPRGDQVPAAVLASSVLVRRGAPHAPPTGHAPGPPGD